MLEQLLHQPKHAQQALQMLHLLVQSAPVCQMLNAGLEEECFRPESGTATAPGRAQMQEPAGHSASSPMEIDADNDADHTAR